MNHLARIAGSFVIVLVVYWTYALTAVPMIEPSLAAKRAARLSPDEARGLEQGDSQQAAELAVLFPPGTMQIVNPKILQSDRLKLLIGDYQTDPSGNVLIKPCAVILLPEVEGAASDELLRRAVVLEAPEGAKLQFHDSFDLSRLKIGRLKSGRLDGPITIRSKGKPDDPSDDLLIVTRDVELSEDLVSTPHVVRFRHGPHFGSGRGLRLRLLRGDGASSGGSSQGPNVAGLESFELAHLDGLHLELPRKNLGPATAFSSPSLPPPTATEKPAAPLAGTMPVDVTCDGPFRFDAVKQKATFDRNVVVTASNATGPPDQLRNCDRLSIYFRRRGAAQPVVAGRARASEEPAKPNDLEPCRLEAVGRPVVFQFPSQSADGRAGHLEYNLITQDLALDGEPDGQPVFFRHEDRRIEARYLRYWSPEPPWRLGRVAAEGPGWIHASAGNRSGQLFEARWNGQLRVQPFEQNQVISLAGGASLAYGALGQLAADAIHFYLNEMPDPAEPRGFKLEPHGMRADGSVRLGAPQISCEVEELRAWFAQDQQGAAGVPVDQAGPADASRSAADAGPRDERTASESPDRHFHVTGRALEAQLVLRDGGKRADVDKLTIIDRVSLIQTQKATADEKPVVVRGDLIHVKDASKPHAALGIKGRPAYFEGSGMTIVGTNINLNAGTNRLWIDDRGFMELTPAAGNPQGGPTAAKDPLRVDWTERMWFDGRTVHFEGNVRGVSQFQQLLTETLEVSLDRMVRFDHARTLQDPADYQLQELRCQGRVWMERRLFDPANPTVQQSREQIETQNLRVNNTTGALSADGPGWVRGWRRGSGGPGPLAELRQRPPTTDATAADKINYLYVRFQGGIAGDVHRREITFHDQVCTLFGPVESWDAMLPEDNPDAWGPDGGQLNTDQLMVREMPSPTADGPSVELEAIGNTRIEGPDYAAFCTRMCYDQNKGIMLLEGDGQTKATLLRQKNVGGFQNRGSAQWIRFSLKTRKIQSGGVGSVDINQFTPPHAPGR
ncbi:MAG: hypothetical protein JW719_10995 [Pirellulales bacterium]|nr:hypothetical protein [Pirellulales bacterium]